MKFLINKFLLILFFYSLSCSASPEKSKPSKKLNYKISGYAQINSMFSALSWANKALILKFETEEVDELITQLNKFSKDNLSNIQKIAKAHKWMDLNKTGLPQIQKDILAEKQKERIKNFLPLIGKSQIKFERELLTSTKAGLNNIAYLTEALLKVETNSKLKAYLSQTNKESKKLYSKHVKLLQKNYYKN